MLMPFGHMEQVAGCWWVDQFSSGVRAEGQSEIAEKLKRIMLLWMTRSGQLRFLARFKRDRLLLQDWSEQRRPSRAATLVGSICDRTLLPPQCGKSVSAQRRPTGIRCLVPHWVISTA